MNPASLIAQEDPVLAQPAPVLRVLIADDHPIYRDGLAAAIAADARLNLVAACPDGICALEGIRRHEPAVVERAAGGPPAVVGHHHVDARARGAHRAGAGPPRSLSTGSSRV